jgi:hypothetical protein
VASAATFSRERFFRSVIGVLWGIATKPRL